MINEVINSIIEAEKRAEEILADAQVKSKEILAGADSERLKTINLGRENTKKQVKEIITEGENAATIAATEVVKRGVADGDLLFQDGMKKSAEARKYIVRRIISKYGTR